MVYTKQLKGTAQTWLVHTCSQMQRERPTGLGMIQDSCHFPASYSLAQVTKWPSSTLLTSGHLCVPEKHAGWGRRPELHPIHLPSVPQG